MIYDPFLLLLKSMGLPAPQCEVQFHPTRRWRADYLWEKERVIVEREGGLWSRNERARAAHAKPLKIQRDMEKSNAAQLLGFVYLRFQPKELDSGKALAAVQQALTRSA